ncbi:hypothetical protein BHM03_00042718 [Ensete ventricosum]|nr:hypothetical protein BHM03_00042718 [Ensete ventricosum]
MRLNYVESFNAFTARIARRRGWSWLAARGSQLRPRPPTRGRLATANPPFGAAGCSQGPPIRGPPATCKGRQPTGATTRKGQPPAGVADCGQPIGATASGAPARANRQRPTPKRLPTAHPQGASRQRLARKRLPTAHPQRAAACGQPARGYPRHTRKGWPPAASPQGATPNRGDDTGRKGGRPLVGRLPVATRSATAYAGAMAAVAQEGEGEG